jgi:S1/P1 Nuclease
MPAVVRALWVLCLLLPGVAGAWGAEGHRIVGLVATELLDARTQRELHALAGEERLADIATWMDEERPRLAHTLPGSGKWHYDNRPLCSPQQPLASYCSDGQCATRAFEHYRRVLADRSAAPTDRLLALRIVVHLVGDAHQPLHAADHGDRGGNDVEVDAHDRGRAHHQSAHARGHSLHAYWDKTLVRGAVDGLDEAVYAHHLVVAHRADQRTIEAGHFDDWMAESYRLSREVAYGHLPQFSCGGRVPETEFLTDSYRSEGEGVVAERLAAAGFRLAAVLRETL